MNEYGWYPPGSFKGATFTNGDNKLEPWIETASGRQFWFDDVHPNNICIDDIGAALSKICRFTGHCKEFYSVAEHSVLVSKIVPPELALAGLLHDASEAYMADISSPLKQLLPEYKKLEEETMEKIGYKFNVDFSSPKIKQADWAQLKVEAKKLLPSGGASWTFPEGLPEGIVPDCWSPRGAEAAFIKRFYDLT